MVNSVKPYSLRASVRIRTLISFLEPDIVMILLVHHGGITAYIVRLFSFVTLTQVNLFRLRCSGIVSGFVLVLTTLSFRDIIVVFLSGSREKKSLLALLLTVFPSLILEKEKGNGTCIHVISPYLGGSSLFFCPISRKSPYLECQNFPMYLIHLPIWNFRSPYQNSSIPFFV